VRKKKKKGKQQHLTEPRIPGPELSSEKLLELDDENDSAPNDFLGITIATIFPAINSTTIVNVPFSPLNTVSLTSLSAVLKIL